MLRHPQHYHSRRAPLPQPEENFYPSSHRSDDPFIHLARKIIAIGGKAEPSILIPVLNPIPGKQASITPAKRKAKAEKIIKYSTEKEAKKAMFAILDEFPTVTITRGARLFRGHGHYIPGTTDRSPHMSTEAGNKWGHWWAPNRAFALSDFAISLATPPWTQNLTEAILVRDAKFLVLAGYGESDEMEEEVEERNPIEDSFFQNGNSYDRWPVMNELQCTQELSEKIAALFYRMTGQRPLGRVTDVGLAHYLAEVMSNIDGYIGIDCDSISDMDTTEVILFNPSSLLKEVVY